jgi:hypothetical protein
MSKLIRQSFIINFLSSSEFNIETNSHSHDSSLRSKVCEIRSLMYFMNYTRPNITYLNSKLSKFTNNLSMNY